MKEEQKGLDEEIPLISLQAMEAVNTYQAMRLVGRLRKHTL